MGLNYGSIEIKDRNEIWKNWNERGDEDNNRNNYRLRIKGNNSVREGND